MTSLMSLLKLSTSPIGKQYANKKVINKSIIDSLNIKIIMIAKNYNLLKYLKVQSLLYCLM